MGNKSYDLQVHMIIIGENDKSYDIKEYNGQHIVVRHWGLTHVTATLTKERNTSLLTMLKQIKNIITYNLK